MREEQAVKDETGFLGRYIYIYFYHDTFHIEHVYTVLYIILTNVLSEMLNYKTEYIAKLFSQRYVDSVSG